MTTAITNSDDESIDSNVDRSGDALSGSTQLVELAPGIFGQPQAGWLVTITTRAGLVQIDCGDQATASMAAIRERLDDPFHAHRVQSRPPALQPGRTRMGSRRRAARRMRAAG